MHGAPAPPHACTCLPFAAPQPHVLARPPPLSSAPLPPRPRLLFAPPPSHTRTNTSTHTARHTRALACAGSSAAVAYVAYAGLSATAGLAYYLSGGLMVVSLLLSAFCVYNILAGGNPPPKKKA